MVLELVLIKNRTHPNPIMVESLNSLFTFRGFHCVLILSLYHFAKDFPTQIKLDFRRYDKSYKSDFLNNNSFIVVVSV